MATTENLLNGTGSQDTFSFTFPYLKDTDIKVSVGGVLKTVTTHYTLHNATTIKFTSGNIPASGTKNVRIYRETDDTALKATFYPGSAIRAGDLNDNATQGLYVVQENNNRVESAWKRGDDTIDSTETWHTSDDTKVGTTKAIENRINSQIDTALENDVLAGTDLAKTASGGQVTINHSVGGANSTVNNSNGTVLQDITISAQGHVTNIGSVDLDGRYYTETEADTNFQPKDAELTELATMGSTTAAALADLTQAEVQILDGATVTTAELNILDGVTATATELNTLDGITSTTAELNILDGVTATATELNKTDGLTSTPTELNILDGATVNTSEINKLDGVTASTTELNIVAGKSFKTSSGTLDTTSDTEIPSSKVIAAHVASSQTAIGGFVTIADEESFPNTQPANGIVVSINNAAGVAINGSGVSTTGRRLDDTTVTINGFPSTLYDETLAAGVGLLVTATSTANTYTYHKILSSETDVKQLSDDINDFNSRYRIAGSAPSSNNDEGDLYFDTAANKMKVYNGSAWDDVASVGSFYINTISSSSGTGGGSATFNNNAYRFTLSNPASGGAQQLIVSINGVIQKPNSGTSQPSEGFAVDGNDIIFAAAPASGSDYFIVTQGSSVSIGTPSANSVNSSHIIDGSIVNADISSSAAIDASKISGLALEKIIDGDTTIECDDTSPAGIEAKIDNATMVRIGGDSTYNSRFAVGPTGDEYIFAFTTGSPTKGRVHLKYGNASKLETTNTGITVTGTVAATAFSGSGASLTSLPAGQLTGTLPAIDGSALTGLPAGGNSVDLVADGAIAAGKSVILTAAGKVKQTAAPISTLSNIEAAAAERQYSTNTDGGIPAESDGRYQSWAYGPTRGAVAHVFRAGNSMGSNQYFAWNSGESSLTEGGGYGMLPYDDHWNNHTAHAITWCKTVNTNNDLFVMTTLDQDNDNLYARAGIMSSTGTVGWGSSKFNIEADGDAETHRDSLCFDPNNDRVIVAYEDKGDSNKGKVRVGTITSSDGFDAYDNLTITWGDAVTFESGDGVKYINCVYDDTADKVVIIWSDGSDSDKGRSIVGTTSSSDNSITLGSEVSFHDSDGAENTRAVYDPDAGRIVVHYRDDGDFDEPYIRSGVVSGTGANATITWTSATVIWGDTPNQVGLAYDTSSNKHVALFTRQSNNWVRTFTINSSTGAVENLADAVQIDDNARGHGDIIALGVDGRILVRFSNGYIRALWTQKANSNITGNTGAGSVLGFVDTAVSDGGTAAVKLTGNVTTSQSGLTVGTKYYIKGDGSLHTAYDSSILTGVTATNTPYAGIAITADKLVIGDLNKTIAS